MGFSLAPHCARSAPVAARRVGVTLAVLLSALALGSCVTEVTPTRSRGVAVKPDRRPNATTAQAPVAMPEGPIARPAGEALSINSIVRVAIRSLGSVPFDSQTLPLISPDGRFLATQTGEAPTWPTILAQPGAALPLRTQIEIYDITQAPPKRIVPAEPLAPGLLLGRAADSAGFLVESPRPDGARWIGKVSWLRGGVEWLSRSDSVTSGAILLSGPGGSGATLYSQRAPSETRCQLIQSGPRAARFPVDDARSLLYPLVSCDGARVACMAAAPDGLELLVFAFASDAAGVARVRARRVLHPAADPLLAYQAATPMQAFPVMCDKAIASYPDGLLFFHPAAERMMFLDLVGDQLVGLAPDSISGCWMHDAVGPAVLLTTPDGLVAQRIVATSDGYEVSAPARLLAEPWAPRATTNPDAPFVLIGPGPRNDPERLSIAILSILPPEIGEDADR